MTNWTIYLKIQVNLKMKATLKINEGFLPFAKKFWSFSIYNIVLVVFHFPKIEVVFKFPEFEIIFHFSIN